jgi:hypothetical protein
LPLPPILEVIVQEKAVVLAGFTGEIVEDEIRIVYPLLQDLNLILGEPSNRFTRHLGFFDVSLESPEMGRCLPYSRVKPETQPLPRPFDLDLFLI